MVILAWSPQLGIEALLFVFDYLMQEHDSTELVVIEKDNVNLLQNFVLLIVMLCKSCNAILLVVFKNRSAIESFTDCLTTHNGVLNDVNKPSVKCMIKQLL